VHFEICRQDRPGNGRICCERRSDAVVSFVHLEKCDGPECPVCGCQDAKIQPGRPRWGRPGSERYRCGACGHVWTEIPADWAEKQEANRGNGQERPPPPPPPQQPPPPPVSRPGGVIYRPVRCPECQSADVKVTSTRRPTRHHKCKACGHTFKSIEESQPDVV
jgi:transposase-like protein